MMDFEEDITNSLAGRVLETIRKYPDNPALELGDRQYTYLELYNSAAAIARIINDLDHKLPYVALMADKSYTCFSGILGVLLAGKAYLPLNPRFPAARNLYMVEKAKVGVIIAGENTDEELEQILENYSRDVFIIFPEEVEVDRESSLAPKIVGPGDPAYLLFTSGTTGDPKAVPVSNSNVTSYLDHMQGYFDFGADDRFTQVFDLTFDLSVHDIFLAWTSGACLVVPEDNSSFAMSGFIREKQPTVWFSVPSVVNLMDKMRLLKPAAFPSIRMSFFCGEALQVKAVEAWHTAVPQSRIINLYGPTEATIAITGYELPFDHRPSTIDHRPSTIDHRPFKSEIGIVSIGKIFGKNSFIINKENPTDDRGELCLAGSQVVKNYLDNELADKDAFFIDPVTGQKYYRTGDVVKIDEEGDLFYLGRIDSEVKISGYRVNLKEIENVLEKYESVRQAVAIYDMPADGAGAVIAFLVADRPEETIPEKDLDRHCREKLPWYMVPGKFIFVNEFPLNANGKIDKNALKQTFYNGK